MKTNLFTVVALIMLLNSSPAFSKILFDIDFSSPLHTDGQPITIDDSINTPSNQNFGSTEMIVEYDGLDGNWSIFNQNDCWPYDQISLELPDGLTEVYFEADVYTQNLVASENSFNIHTDSKGYGARSLDFHGAAGLYVFNFGTTDLTNFNDGQLYHLKIHADATYDIFTVEVNGSELYSSTLGSNDITSFRLTIGPWTGIGTECSRAIAAVSNILIYETAEDLLSEPELEPEIELENEITNTKGGSLSITLLFLLAFMGMIRLKNP